METITTLSKTLVTLSQKEREATSDVVRELAELDRSQGFRELGYSSLFAYCREVLLYSEGAAMRRITAARALKDSPDIYEKLRAGALTLCSIVEISKVKDVATRVDLLVAAEGQSKREVQKLVAVKLPPEAPKKETVRVKAVLPPPPLPVFGEGEARPEERRYTVSFEVDEAFMELLNKAQSYSSQVRVSDVLRQALTHFVRAKTPKIKVSAKGERGLSLTPPGTAASTGLMRARKPAAEAVTATAKRSRYVRKAVRDKVCLRDGQRCTFVSPDGHRCTATRGLELEHCYPFALGGESTEENLRLLCPAHNRLVAERVFGKGKMGASNRASLQGFK